MKNQQNKDVIFFDNLTKEVVKDITGFRLDSYLLALEGWRRGLTLKWYKDETSLCKLDKLNSSTHGRFFSLSSGEKTHYFFRSRGDLVANKTVRICQNKETTKKILAEKGISIPLGSVLSVENDKEILSYAKEVGYPVVIKPLNGSMGKGVFPNIKDENELKEVLDNVRSTYNYTEYIVEKHYPGKEYRVYVVGDHVIGATNRLPANVIGNGESTVQELIEAKNEERKSNPYLAPKPIKVDFEVKSLLKQSGYTLGSIPSKGERVFLREKSNLSSGGDPMEATDELTEEVKQLAVDALKALPSIPHAGVDVIVNPKNKKEGVVLEANATAEIAFHLFPLEGNAKDVTGAIIDYYFPETKGKKKSNFYFDYNSLLEPLSTWAAEEITITKAPVGRIFGKRYNVTGKVNKVGYMNWIRRQALTRGFHGYVKKIDKNNVEIIAVGANKDELDKFVELCYKGSKRSQVNNVEVEEVQLSDYKPLKVGFELIL